MLARTLDVVNYRDLLRNLVTRDLKVRYRGSVIGFLWSLLNPVLMMAVYWFVFTKLLKSDKPQFHIFVFVALLPWNWCAAAVMGAMTSIVGNAHLIKKVYFPRELLPLSTVVSNGINFLLALPVLFALMLLADSSALHTLTGHTAPVQAVAYSSDAAYIASAANDNTVRLWRTADWAPLHILGGAQAPVNTVAFAPDTQTLVSGSDDHTVRWWRRADGALLRISDIGTPVHSVAFAPSGQVVAAAGDDGSIHLLRASDGAALATWRVPGIPIWGLAYAPDGRTLAAAMDDNTVRLWDVADPSVAPGAPVRTLQGTSQPVIAVAWHGDLIAGGATDGTARIWRASDGTLLHTIAPHAGSVYSVAFSPDGQTLATTGDDHTVRTWHVSDGSAIRSYEGHAAKVTAVAYSPDGMSLASGSADATVRTWAANPPLGLHFSPNIAWIPLLVVTQAIFLGGICFFLSALNVFFRDTQAIMEVGIQAWFFLTPVIYSAEDVLPQFTNWMYWLNPMASIISSYRIILYYDGLDPLATGPDPAFMLRTLLTSAVVLVAGYMFFRSVARNFGEEL